MTAPTLLPSTNPLIAQTQNTNTWHSGINLLDDAASLHQGITSGSWIESGLSAVGTSMDVLTILSNPVATLVSYGLNFLIEHIKPLQDALNWFAGNAGQVSSYGGTWGNVSKSISGAGSSFLDTLKKDTAGWTGQAADNYRNFAQDKINTLSAAAKAANTIGSATQLIGGLVGTVRQIIRDFVTQAMGQIVQTALAAVFVVSIPAVVAKVATEVVSWMRKIANTVQQLTSSMTKLQPLMGDLQKLWGTITQSLAKGGQKMETVASDLEKGIEPTVPSATTAPKSTTPPPVEPPPVNTSTPAPPPGPTAPKATTPKPIDPAKDPQLSRDAAWEKHEADQAAANPQLTKDEAFAKHEADLAKLDGKLDKQYTLGYDRGPNYRTEVEVVNGPPPADGNAYVAHHPYPVDNAAQFREIGIDTTNPTYGSWVERGSHEQFSNQYGKQWNDWFANTPNPTAAQAEQFARQLAQQHNYQLPF